MYSYYYNKFYDLRNKKCGCIIYDIFSKDLLLVQGKSSNIWSFPKGSKENYETDIITAWRETYEETGLDVKNEIQNQYKIRINRNTYFIIPINNKKDLHTRVLDINEISTIKWIRFEDLNFYHCNKDVRKSKRYLYKLFYKYKRD